eukprot:1959450-Rhodomonas_salina.1
MEARVLCRWRRDGQGQCRVRRSLRWDGAARLGEKATDERRGSDKACVDGSTQRLVSYVGIKTCQCSSKALLL